MSRKHIKCTWLLAKTTHVAVTCWPILGKIEMKWFFVVTNKYYDDAFYFVLFRMLKEGAQGSPWTHNSDTSLINCFFFFILREGNISIKRGKSSRKDDRTWLFSLIITQSNKEFISVTCTISKEEYINIRDVVNSWN